MITFLKIVTWLFYVHMISNGSVFEFHRYADLVTEENVGALGILSDLLIGVLVVVGWFVAYRFAIRQERLTAKDKAQLDVYRNLAERHDEFQKASAEFAARLQVETILKYVGTSGGAITPMEHVKDLLECNKVFQDRYLQYLQLFEIWSALVPDLERAVSILTEESNKLHKRLGEYLNIWLEIDKLDDSKWDRTKIKSAADFSILHIRIFSSYVIDLTNLTHNELATPILGREKKIRSIDETVLPVLTKHGIEEPGNLNSSWYKYKHLL